MSRCARWLSMAAVCVLAGGLATSLAEDKAAKPEQQTNPAFEKLKGMAGEWVIAHQTPAEDQEAAGKKAEGAEQKADKPGGKDEGKGKDQSKDQGKEKAAPAEAAGGKSTEPQMTTIFKVVSSGSVVMEHMFPGTPHEMITMYHQDGPDVVLTHYCAARNQPRMKLEKSDDPNRLPFKFTGGTNMDPAKDGHMHDVTFTFLGPDHVRAEWVFFDSGKPSKTEIFELQRKK